MTGLVDGHSVSVGGPSMLDEHGARPLAETVIWQRQGAIILHVLRDGVVIGAIGLADEIREESRQAVDTLHQQGIEVVMITGDAEAVARSVAAELGIDRVFAGVHPEDKARKELQQATPPVPQTVETVKEDIQWAKTQTGSAGK